MLLPLTLALVRSPLPLHDSFRDEIERTTWELLETTSVPGVAIAVLRDGELEFAIGCGWADVEADRLVTEDTVFNVGSISKCVGAWGLMKLVEAGALGLEAPAATEGWSLPPSDFDSRGVTLERLLSHTAGLSLHGYPGFWPPDEPPSLVASLAGDTNGAGDVRLEAAPGSRWKYSGGGYSLAQLLLEETTGRDFASFLRDEVLVPLGMQHSEYGWSPATLTRSATPYDGDGSALPRGGPRFAELAAAGLQTTALDMARFALASLPRFRSDDEERVLAPATIERMQTRVEPGTYGLGYEVEERGDIRLVGHGGANRGWIAYLRLVPATGDGLVVLTNSTAGNAIVAPLDTRWFRRVQEDAQARAAERR